ncbi:MAG: sigma-54 factor interaction domain-containing protein, partial [Candidatus Sumerlaeia bacterium]|nr:sigma-54 factor interaction domain-containing protein [Candidatus Sumerlaeia bacterium]
MTQVLFAWLGTADINASKANDSNDLGPICQAVRWKQFNRVVILADQGKNADDYRNWLLAHTNAIIDLRHFVLTSPTNHGEIYEAAISVLTEHVKAELTFHLSPGTPAMASVWVLLGKTRFPATLIESSKSHGVREAHVPFDISVDYIPVLLQKPDDDLKRLSQGLPPENSEFESILHRSDMMKRLVVKARRVAPRNIPVLLLGESGTGKELFARAIHHSSPRKDKAFIAVNCGAIPEELVDSELFGHEKGAFTGAMSARPGHIMAAHGGTLFLDEIGELPLKSQIRLLRVLQESEVTRVGATLSKKVDFRLICATNRDLATEIADQRFREDLYH